MGIINLLPNGSWFGNPRRQTPENPLSTPQEDSSPTKALNKEDFPALGFPQIAT